MYRFRVFFISKIITKENIILVIILFAGFWVIRPFLMTILLSVITAYILYPLVNRLRKILKSYNIALFTAILMIAVPFSLIILYSVNDITFLSRGVLGLGLEAKDILEGLEGVLATYGLDSFAINTQTMVNDMTIYLLGQAKSFVFSIPMLLLDIAIYLIATYYFLKDGDKGMGIINGYIETLEEREKRMARSIMLGLKNSFDVLFLSYITISVIVVLFAWAGFTMMGIQYAAVLAILCGIFSFLPMLGIWIIYASIAVMELLNGNPTTAVIAVGYGVVFLNIIPDFYIRPILGSKQGNVHPMTVLMGFFGGPIVFGLKGFLIGPIILVIVETVVLRYMDFCIKNKGKCEPEQIETE